MAGSSSTSAGSVAAGGAALVEAMRPHQWVKNLLVLAPLGFAHRIDDLDATRRALLAFALFCALSSATYLLNDLVDRTADAAHPTKRERPIASGRLPPAVAVVAALALLAGVAIATAVLTAAPLRVHVVPFATWPIAYALLNVGYSTALKRVVILDCLCIALGFVIRVHAGAVAIDVRSSSWILMCTFFFALFLAFCKRREEVARMAGDPTTRRTNRDYDVDFLDQLIAPLAALSILCYALYTVDPETRALQGPNMTVTVPIVVFGVFRYLWLVHRRGEGADPARLLFRDGQLVASGVLWVAAVAAIIGLHGAHTAG